MKKRLIELTILFVILFSLTACNQGLAAYKEDAKSQIESYAATKDQNNYSAENWVAIQSAVSAGKTAIDVAISKADIDTMVTDAKTAIDEVQKEDDLLGVEVGDMIELHTWFFTSGVPNNAIKFKHENDKAVFKCTVDKGQLFFGESGVKALAVKSGDTIYWHDTAIVEQAFISIIVKVDDIIKGYGVIKITQNKGAADHTASVLKAMLISKVDNEYQCVSEEQVEKIINEIIINKGG